MPAVCTRDVAGFHTNARQKLQTHIEQSKRDVWVGLRVLNPHLGHRRNLDLFHRDLCHLDLPYWVLQAYEASGAWSETQENRLPALALKFSRNVQRSPIISSLWRMSVFLKQAEKGRTSETFQGRLCGAIPAPKPVDSRKGL